MKINLNNIIIEYSKDLNYIDNIVSYIELNEKEILSFFRIDKLSKKYILKILNYDEFKKYIINKYGEIKPYVRGDTDSKSNTIVVLDIEDQIKYTIHKDACTDDVIKMVMHEFVHACNNEVCNCVNEIVWFEEGLATNLAKQNYSLCSLDDCDFNMLKNNFNNCKNNYKYSYTIVNYILNNYSKDEIFNFISNVDYLINSSDKIFKTAKEWIKNNI